MNLPPSEATCSFEAGLHVGGGDLRAEAARGGDGLQAGDAGAHDENPGGGNRARRRHHHRHGLLEHRGGIDDGLVAGEVGLARQHVHRLRARDARHELHGEQRGVARGQRLQRAAVAVRIEHGDDERAGLQRRHVGGGGAADLQEDVGVTQRVRRGGHDLRALRAQRLVGEARAGARAGLDLHLGAERGELLDRLGRHRNAWLVRSFGRNRNGDHALVRSGGGFSHRRARAPRHRRRVSSAREVALD